MVEGFGGESEGYVGNLIVVSSASFRGRKEMVLSRRHNTGFVERANPMVGFLSNLE